MVDWFVCLLLVFLGGEAIGCCLCLIKNVALVDDSSDFIEVFQGVSSGFVSSGFAFGLWRMIVNS